MTHTKDPAVDGPDVFDGYPMRRQLGVASRARRAWATAYELGHDVQRTAGEGPVKGTLRTLATYGVFGLRKDRRGERDVEVFNFDARWDTALDDAVRRASVGLLDTDRRVIVVPLSGLQAVAELLRTGSYGHDISWMAEFDDSTLGVAIGIEPQAPPVRVTRIIVALQNAGTSPTRARVAQAIHRDELARWSRGVLDADGDLALEP